MIFKTHNTTYTLTDAGDGAFFISGHPKYCPRPTLCTLDDPVKLGHMVVFRTASHPNPIITTPVLEMHGSI